ncbi:MAG TPA: hypothetical protein HPQ03_15085 [Deltaproteobacteria bacterium]|nr:hypothetical protein [Deltaproteobacteria bacterium]
MAIQRFQYSLKRQLKLLWQSCRNFDDSNTDVAIQMAVILRIIFHTTKMSTSLLTHLKSEHINLLSTCPEIATGRSSEGIYEGGLTISKRGLWVASLDESSVRRQISFQDWWISDIVCIYSGIKYNRRKIVLDIANKGDGAHVVKKVPNHLEKFIKGHWTVTEHSPNGKVTKIPSSDQNYQYIRQIAYEALHSEELLELVETGFRLKTDREIAEENRNLKDKALAKVQKLYETAIKLSENSQCVESQTIVDMALEELYPLLSTESVELLGLLLLLRANNFGPEEPKKKIEAYEHICKTYEKLFSEIKLQGNNLKIYEEAKIQIKHLNTK